MEEFRFRPRSPGSTPMLGNTLLYRPAGNEPGGFFPADLPSFRILSWREGLETPKGTSFLHEGFLHEGIPGGPWHSPQRWLLERYFLKKHWMLWLCNNTLRRFRSFTCWAFTLSPTELLGWGPIAVKGWDERYPPRERAVIKPGQPAASHGQSCLAGGFSTSTVLAGNAF